MLFDWRYHQQKIRQPDPGFNISFASRLSALGLQQPLSYLAISSAMAAQFRWRCHYAIPHSAIIFILAQQYISTPTIAPA